MIESFFRSLETEGVAYLLISGQASVLYGAAVFSEDIDLWVEPTTANTKALHAALCAVGATYYKLTPPVDVPYMMRGHGFHFRIPGVSEFYLDVMGQPPRVPVFGEAVAAAPVISTAWGNIPTIGIKHLVAMKSTQRLGDYPIISQLVLRYMENTLTPVDEDYRWAIENLHTIDEFGEFLRTYPDASALCETSPLREFASVSARRAEIPRDIRILVERWLSERILALRQADHEYWNGIIAEIRELRRAGQLMPVGAPVVQPS